MEKKEPSILKFVTGICEKHIKILHIKRQKIRASKSLWTYQKRMSTYTAAMSPPNAD